MSSLRIADIIKQALTVETNGEVFYKTCAEKFSANVPVKVLFNELADEEIVHRNYFASLLQASSTVSLHEDIESGIFMDSFVKRMIFDSERFRTELKFISTVKEALDFAIRRELDSVLYYYELKRLTDPEQAEHIDKIADEERRHVVRLTALQETLQDKEEL